MRRIITLRYGLDQPLPVRYVRWFVEAMQGNLGYKLGGVGLPVLDTVMRGLGASLLLMGTALLIGIFVGIPLGMLSALRQYSKTRLRADRAWPSWASRSRRSCSGCGGLYLFGLTLRIFPIGGMVTAGQPFSVGGPDLAPGATGAHPGRRLRRGPDALHALRRCSRCSARCTSRPPIAKGLPPRIVVTRHALRNALIPIVTIIGLSLPELVGGAVIIETVFSWPGLGSMMVEARARAETIR